jgi:hypothetical protein
MAAKIPFPALTGNSQIALLSVNMNTRKYGGDGKVIDGERGDPKIEVVALDSLERYTISVKALDSALTKITDEQIALSLKSRRYILVELSDALATPYTARSGFGINYSVKADSAAIVPQAVPVQQVTTSRVPKTANV